MVYLPCMSCVCVVWCVQIIVVLAVVFAVIVYRLAVGTIIYSLVSGTSLGPAVGSIIVSITGAAIQLVAIIIMNKFYEFLAFKLTNWGGCVVVVFVVVVVFFIYLVVAYVF